LIRLHLLPILLLAGLSGCGPSYSPDTYATNAVQQANKAEQGVIVGVRKVAISAAGTVGTVTGAAAGGIAGSQVGVGPVSAFSALGGSLVGGLAGSAVEHASADTDAFEYIVRKPNNELVSITQRDKVPLAIGEKVLVIGGNQARVVPDYTVTVTDKRADPAKPADAAKPAAPPAAASVAAQPDAHPDAHGDTHGDSKSATTQPAAAPAVPASPAAAASTPGAPASAPPPSGPDAPKPPANGTPQPPGGAPDTSPAAAS
jgi:outer membrane lipoprotein SlyB